MEWVFFNTLNCFFWKTAETFIDEKTEAERIILLSDFRLFFLFLSLSFLVSHFFSKFVGYVVRRIDRF